LPLTRSVLGDQVIERLLDLIVGLLGLCLILAIDGANIASALLGGSILGSLLPCDVLKLREVLRASDIEYLLIEAALRLWSS
jgi:hypothetical protein